ncbi:MAG: hypothetical protein FIA99_11455 [Ruminiclostridium sp.]|nr:hypothetical protein [Ruminiclostridium sp.]
MRDKAIVNKTIKEAALFILNSKDKVSVWTISERFRSNNYVCNQVTKEEFYCLVMAKVESFNMDYSFDDRD